MKIGKSQPYLHKTIVINPKQELTHSGWKIFSPGNNHGVEQNENATPHTKGNIVRQPTREIKNLLESET